MKSSPQREWTCSHVPLKCLETHKKCQCEQALFGWWRKQEMAQRNISYDVIEGRNFT